jgi:hypothetical protein
MGIYIPQVERNGQQRVFATISLEFFALALFFGLCGSPDILLGIIQNSLRKRTLQSRCEEGFKEICTCRKIRAAELF